MAKYLQISIGGGLCNKLFHLFSACEIAIKKNYIIIEPYFGWKEKILFSEIYNIHFFNESMKKYNNNNNIIIEQINVPEGANITFNDIPLWKLSEKNLKKQREKCIMRKNCMNIAVLKSLKINEKYEHILDLYNVNTAMHIRIESDWVKYNKCKKITKNETLLIDINKLIKMYKKTNFSNDIFITTGENQNEIVEKLKSNNLNPTFFFDTNYEYELNAAINFELCVKAKRFIGLSRSTFSNLITLRRSLNKNESSFIYNIHNRICRRKDKGLQPDPSKSTTKHTKII